MEALDLAMCRLKEEENHHIVSGRTSTSPNVEGMIFCSSYLKKKEF